MTYKPKPLKTPQQVFDAVARHLHKQGCKSGRADGDGFVCLYRGPYGRMCAIGPFLSDEEASNVEGFSIGSLKMPRRVQCFVSVRLLIRLQSVHDGYEVKEWPDALREVADDFRLSPKIIKQLWKETQA